MILRYSIFLTFFVHFVKSPLPSILPVCFRDDPQLAKCLVLTANILRTRFTTGDLGNGFRIPRLDPIYIPRITYGREHTLQTRMMNIYVRGFSNFKIENFYLSILDGDQEERGWVSKEGQVST
ncbi:uncharacterized protein [Chironomus tepperi]|uniref:uncharacterized protein isoform X2 n=1 Tax=Chironomus tepperi TaxID=113505 RepID=UPI00391F0641